VAQPEAPTERSESTEAPALRIQESSGALPLERRRHPGDVVECSDVRG